MIYLGSGFKTADTKKDIDKTAANSELLHKYINLDREPSDLQRPSSGEPKVAKKENFQNITNQT